ncbi:glycoside hydrolase family 15 protein [Halomarina pelagica]|uniref:glycoside hydrolase family 15 protein n=1 Tax=Halomarina pelagica TaxID=2961599 RepID=UPI0020C39EF8|nr:glycoside hydrolase family 15 protein [Halomarina sp. BND7]
MSEYPPLEDYGLVGNLETCALVSVDGSIDWCPLPHLESPSVFAHLLDADGGGHFRIRPAAAYASAQRYLDRTNVLRTEFRTAMGDLAVTDFMPIVDDEGGGTRSPAIYRRVTCERGRAEVEIAFEPRFDYARAETIVEARDGGLLAAGGDETALLMTDRPFDVSDDGATATVALTAGDAEWFVLRYGDAEPVADGRARRLLDDTVSFWRGWAHTCDESECVFGGPWHDLVVRSGLVLKLLTHRETGAIAAAPTTSLPEDVGGVRNWDYRYNWLRDAAFTIQALSNLHHGAEARSYFEWFLDRCRAEDPERIQPLYGLHGDPDLAERELEHLSGYRDSSPVRVGNGAIHQRQLDIYGELVLAIYETVSDDGSLERDDWDAVRGIIDYVPEIWREPDAGIWEVRGGTRHFVFSKLMCWVALDRGVAIAEERGFDAPFDRWRAVRDEIREAVLEKGYSEERGAFVRAFDDDALDATALLVPLVGFLPFDDERVQRTIDAIRAELMTEEGLVRRYDGDDGLPGEEGTFVLCSFWLVDALALSGRVEEAREVFLNVLDYANPLGLLAEEIDEGEGVQVGNYPQAFSHVGLINSALYLGRMSGRTSAGIEPMGLELGEGVGTSGR